MGGGVANKGSFTYYLISQGGGGFQMLTVDYGGGVEIAKILIT